MRLFRAALQARALLQLPNLQRQASQRQRSALLQHVMLMIRLHACSGAMLRNVKTRLLGCTATSIVAVGLRDLAMPLVPANLLLPSTGDGCLSVKKHCQFDSRQVGSCSTDMLMLLLLCLQGSAKDAVADSSRSYIPCRWHLPAPLLALQVLPLSAIMHKFITA